MLENSPQTLEPLSQIFDARLTELFFESSKRRAAIWVPSSIQLDENCQPQTDLVLLLFIAIACYNRKIYY